MSDQIGMLPASNTRVTSRRIRSPWTSRRNILHILDGDFRRNVSLNMLKRLLPWSVQSVFRFLASSKESSISKLPDEILLNVLFPYLDLLDILSLRKVCKWFYHLTHHAVVWKRLLRSSPLSLPPLPPTSRHTFENLTAIEAEALLVRAQSLDRNWSKNYSSPETWSFAFEYRVAEMTVLPGCRYMVASISDFTRTKWDLMLCVLDSRYGVIPIARTSTKTKAFGLRARYLTVKGVPGVTIAFVRRDWVHRKDGKKGVNISDFSGEHVIDTPYPVKHECLVYHVTLDSIEALNDPLLVPGSQQYIKRAQDLAAPFQQLCMVRSRSQRLGPLVLDHLAGEPYMSLVKYPNTIIFKPLNDGPAMTLDLLPNPAYSNIVSR
ncbi:hypothetical protein BC835DRAFT_90455 [Cytidiella melzeri]|nr:hypothetical protein BC835DRAFT_90455 [Cytidiella melzeri]